jgi:hypothetical protein
VVPLLAAAIHVLGQFFPPFSHPKISGQLDKERGEQSQMKTQMKILSAVVMALALLAPGVMPTVAHAAPTAKVTTGAIQVARGIYMVRASAQSMQPMHPRAALSNCSSESWIALPGYRKSWPDYVLQATLWVLVDYTYHDVYCGSVMAQGDDRLLNNCHNFEGYAASTTSFNTTYGYWSQFHCTHTEYTIGGPIAHPTCPRGYVLVADTGVTDDWLYADPHVPSTEFVC